MLFEGIKLVTGSEVQKLVADSGPIFPTASSLGEMFYYTGLDYPVGLYVWSGATWDQQLNTNASLSGLLPNIISGGTFKSVTVDTKGRVTAGSNPTSLTGYGITDAQPLNPNLTNIVNQVGTGLLEKIGADTWTLNNTPFITSAGAPVQSVAGRTGAVTLSKSDISGLSAGDSQTFNNLTLSGTLTVDGSTVTINSTDVSIADINLQIGSQAADGLAVDGGGLTLGNFANSPSIVYGNLNDNFTFNRRIDALSFHGPLTGDVTGDVTGNVTGNVMGNLTGNVTGNVTGDVTGNVSGTASSITGIYTGALTALQVTNAIGFIPSSTSGTVTSVSALTLTTSGTDVSSTVATSTTTPAITLNLPSASASARGLLTAADWTTFNDKQPAGSYLTAAVLSLTVVGSNGITGYIGGTASIPEINLSLEAITPTSITTSGQFTSNIATGLSPFVINSTTKVTNLNADLLDGLHAATANTASTVVARDASGNFAAGTITATLTGTADNVVTNANLTGPITSTGNTTAVASQTGTGTTFVMNDSPTLLTPNIGVATGTSFNSITGLSSSSPEMNGVAGAGSSTAVAKADHIHPSDTSKLSLSGGSMTGTLTIPTGKFITIVDYPLVGTSATNKNYVDAVAAGLSWKNSAVAATTTDITLSGPQTIDGVAVIAGNRVLVKNQTVASQNGIYEVATGAWSRTSDMDATTPLNEFNGAGILVTGGTTQINTGWTVSSNVVQVDTSAVTWAQFNGAAGITAGIGLTFTGNTLDVDASQTGITTLGTVTGTSFNSITGLADAVPLENGTATIGSSTLVAKADHIHPLTPTNIAEGTRTTTTVPITSSTGTSATLSAATTTLAGVMSSADKSKLDNISSGATANTGTVTSVDLTVPAGLTVANGPITDTGTLAISFDTGYAIPTTAKQGQWDTAYTDRNKWDGGTTGLTASTGRSSLGATTIGSNLFTLTNPGAITFPRFNADNSVSTLSAATFRSAIGAGTSSTTGTVTSASITTNNGVSGTVTDTSGALAILLTMGDVTGTSFNSITGLSATTISALGTQAVGTSTLAARADHVHAAPTTVSGQAGYVANAVTFRSDGSGDAVNTSYDGSAARTISYNTIGAAPTSHSHASYLTSAVTSLSMGTTGLTPSLASTGAVTVAGTLNVANGGTGISSYTAGDILYASGTTTLVKLAKGTDGQVLKLSGGVPSWGTDNDTDTNTWIKLTGSVDGYVTAQGSSDTSKYLNGSGAWSTPPDTNTWDANAVNTAGYVSAPGGGAANLVWKTDGAGNPGWRADADTVYSLPIASASTLGGVKDGTGLTIDAGGIISVDFGSTSTTVAAGNHTHTSLASLAITNTTNATSSTTGAFTSDGGIGVALSIYAGGDITAASDARLKTNIVRITSALSKVDQLNGYTYDRTDIDIPRQTGVIAQEVLRVLPEAVSGTEETTYGVAYGNMVGLLIEAIKELKSEVTDLKSEISMLKAGR